MRKIAGSVERGGGCHAVLRVVIHPEDFATAGCDAQIWGKVGEGGEGGFGDTTEGRKRRRGWLRLEAYSNNIQRCNYNDTCISPPFLLYN